MVNIMLQFAGADQRQDDLFANENFFSRGKSALKGLKVRSTSLVSSFARRKGTDVIESLILGSGERLYSTHTAFGRDVGFVTEGKVEGE